jgi:hypothetical protein
MTISRQNEDLIAALSIVQKKIELAQKELESYDATGVAEGWLEDAWDDLISLKYHLAGEQD